MSVGRTFSQPVGRWLIAGLALLLVSSAGAAVGEAPEPPMGLAPAKPAAPMPAFKLPSLNGSTFDSSQLQGKVVVLRIWATW